MRNFRISGGWTKKSWQKSCIELTLTCEGLFVAKGTGVQSIRILQGSLYPLSLSVAAAALCRTRLVTGGGRSYLLALLAVATDLPKTPSAGLPTATQLPLRT